MKHYVIMFLENGKTCKELSYEIKLQNDEITNIYRKAYKTQNAKKQRNIHIPNIDEKFKKWVEEAKYQKELCKKEEISPQKFKKWLKENEEWHIRKEEDLYSLWLSL